MNKLFFCIGSIVVMMEACSRDVTNETQIGQGDISPWHSLTEEEIREVAAAVIDSTDDGVIFNRISLLEPHKEQAIAWQGSEPARRGRAVSQ